MSCTDGNNLLTIQRTDLKVEAFLAQISEEPPCEIEKVSTDTRAWLVRCSGEFYFVKWVETNRYEDRLAKDVALCSRALHPAIPRLWNSIQTADGILTVFEKVNGETLSEQT